MRFRVAGILGGVVSGIIGILLGFIGYLLLCQIDQNAADAMFCIFNAFIVGPACSLAGFSFAYWGGPVSAAVGFVLVLAVALLALHGMEFLLVLVLAYLAMILPGLLLRRAMRASRTETGDCWHNPRMQQDRDGGDEGE